MYKIPALLSSVHQTVLIIQGMNEFSEVQKIRRNVFPNMPTIHLNILYTRLQKRSMVNLFNLDE